jgi:hypothetical protein
MESEENQKQVFPPFPPPLEIAAAISTFPPRRGLLPLSKRKINPKNQNRKEFSRYRPPYFRSGSFFDENMLRRETAFDGGWLLGLSQLGNFPNNLRF